MRATATATRDLRGRTPIEAIGCLADGCEEVLVTLHPEGGTTHDHAWDALLAGWQLLVPDDSGRWTGRCPTHREGR